MVGNKREALIRKSVILSYGVFCNEYYPYRVKYVLIVKLFIIGSPVPKWDKRPQPLDYSKSSNFNENYKIKKLI